MSEFLQLAQSLTVAMKAMQMYTARHPRAQESLAVTHANLNGLLEDKERLQFVVTGLKAFVDGQVQDPKSPHINILVKLVSERGVSGFVFERGVEVEELLAFLQGLTIKPPKLEAMGGFEALLREAGVRHIRLSQTRYQEVTVGEEGGGDEEKAPMFSPAPPEPPPVQTLAERLNAIREALLASLSRQAAAAKDSTGGSMDQEELGRLKGFGPADLSGLGILADELGLGAGMPTPEQLGTLRQLLTGLTPTVQLSLLAGMGSLPQRPEGLALAIKALAGELLAGATSAALAEGASWAELQGPIQEILRTQSDRASLLGALAEKLRASGQEALVKSPSSAPAPPAPVPTLEERVKSIRATLMAALARQDPASGDAAGDNKGGDGQGMLKDFSPADLSGLGIVGEEIGLGSGAPTPVQLGTLRQVLTGLSPSTQLRLLAGIESLPQRPEGLALGMKALAGELLANATSTALAKGASWIELKGPVQEILRPHSDRASLLRTLTGKLRASGQDAAPAEALLRNLEWEALSLEAKLLRALEEGQLFELSLEQRLAFLRELLDLRRFDEFLRIQDALLEGLSSERSYLRLKAAQTLAGVARWAETPGLPPGGEGALADALRAHFAWEPDPPLHRWTTGALETLLVALVHRGEFGHVISDLQELEGLCAFLEEQHPWRNEALASLRAALLRPQLMAAMAAQAFSLEREQMVREVFPYLEFLGEPAARFLVERLGDESDRARRGRMVEAVRSLGADSLPALLDAIASPTWFLVRNALTILSDLGDADHMPSVLPLLRHPESRVRRTAVRALWKLGGPAAEPHLLALMKNTDAETMQEILFALGQLRSEAGLHQVGELARDKRVVEQIRIQALDTLGHIASPLAMPILKECLRRRGFFGGGEQPPIRLAAARALLALDTREAIDTLRRLADAEPRGEEREAFRRLLEPPVQP